MMNTRLFNSMIKEYNRLSYTHNYIYGFTFEGVVYMAEANASVMPYILTIGDASRGYGKQIRFMPNRQQKLMLMENCRPLCSIKFFNETVADSIYNKGEIFEKMVTEFFGQEWIKDNVPFTDGGDIEIDGVAYQIKFEKASFCSEKSLINLKKKMLDKR